MPHYQGGNLTGSCVTSTACTEFVLQTCTDAVAIVSKRDWTAPDTKISGRGEDRERSAESVHAVLGDKELKAEYVRP